MQLSEEHVVTDSTETTCIVRGLMKSLRNEYSQDSQCREVFIRTISKWFGTLSGDDDPATPIAPATPVAPVAPVAAGVESVMMNAILRQLDEAHLQRSGAVIDKVRYYIPSSIKTCCVASHTLLELPSLYVHVCTYTCIYLYGMLKGCM